MAANLSCAEGAMIKAWGGAKRNPRMGMVCEQALKARLEIRFGFALCRAYLLAPSALKITASLTRDRSKLTRSKLTRDRSAKKEVASYVLIGPKSTC
jgi:hypothetical protein